MMLDKKQIFGILKTNKPFLEKEMGVKRIGLFGSYVKDWQTDESDVDIYLEIQDSDDYKKYYLSCFFWNSKSGKEWIWCTNERR